MLEIDIPRPPFVHDVTSVLFLKSMIYSPCFGGGGGGWVRGIVFHQLLQIMILQGQNFT